MAQGIISFVCRLVRAGDEFSETNQKLRKAIDAWITHLWDNLDGEPLPILTGWSIARDSGLFLKLGFQHHEYGWRYVTADWENQPIQDVLLCCQALAGEEGKKLLAWLEESTAERQSYVSAFAAFHSALEKH